MRFYSEKQAEDFLENFGFNVIERVYCKKKSELQKALSVVGLPCVMKVSGKKIVHKNKVGGIRLNIDTYSHAVSEFDSLKKIKGSDGVMIQRKISFSKEFLLGVKKTKDFGHVVIFGSGGTDVEEKKDVSFRVLPLSEEDAVDMIKSVKIAKGMGKKEVSKIAQVVMRLGDLVSKYSEISELDINPFVLAGEGPIVLDARILFE